MIWIDDRDTTLRLELPENITLLPLPPRAPELNPVENIWHFLRQNWLANRVFKSYDDILDHWPRGDRDTLVARIIGEVVDPTDEELPPRVKRVYETMKPFRRGRKQLEQAETE